MIEKMTKYSFILTGKENDGFLDSLSGLGLMDITRSGKPCDEKSAGMLAAAAALKDRINLLEKGKYSLDPVYSSLKEELANLEKTIEARSVWGEIDFDKLGSLKENGVELLLYCVPEKKYDPAWEQACVVEILERSGGKVYFAVVLPAGSESPVPFKPSPMPETSISSLEADKERLCDSLKKREAEINAEKETLPEMKKAYSDKMHELDLYLAGASGENAADGYLTVYKGFAPTECDATLCKSLDDLGYFYLSESATAADNPPIKLRNNWFARQFEVLTGMYGMPVYDEFDPTPILAPFFLLFFSMCMGDAGYGILLVAVSLVLRNMQGGLAKLWRLVLMLGIGTFFVGIVLGTFFGISLAEAAWVPQWLKDCMITGEIAGFNAQMVLALAIGIFHICLAMVIKAVIYTRRFGFKNTISTWGWVVLIVGGLTVAGFALAGVLSSRITRIAIIVIGVVSALGIFIFNKPGRNPLINVGAGLWDTYGMVTGLTGDILSYIRLFALGLAGGMLGAAFNTLASMTLGQNPTWHWIPFAIIVLIGHTLNFAMACLGAFVHPLRLNFLEFFKNSGYEGKGTAYNPINNNN